MTKISNSSDSRLQSIEIEGFLISSFSGKNGVELCKRRLPFGSGKSTYFMEIDGYSKKPPILCEAWAHNGKAKGAQFHKVTNDALKLIFLERKIGKNVVR